MNCYEVSYNPRLEVQIVPNLSNLIARFNRSLAVMRGEEEEGLSAFLNVTEPLHSNFLIHRKRQAKNTL